MARDCGGLLRTARKGEDGQGRWGSTGDCGKQLGTARVMSYGVKRIRSQVYDQPGYYRRSKRRDPVHPVLNSLGVVSLSTSKKTADDPQSVQSSLEDRRTGQDHWPDPQ